MAAPDPADDSRYRIRMAGAIERRPRIIEIHSLEGRGEAVRVTLAPDLAVGHDVETSVLLGANREQRRVVLRLFEERLRDTPELLRAHPRRKAAGELCAID